MLLFSLVLLLLLLMNFSFSVNIFKFNKIFEIFIEMKFISSFFVKMMGVLVFFLFLNYSSYVYLSVGLSMNYGVVLIYALLLVSLGWVIWVKNNWMVMMSHFLPSGIEGVLKLVIPLLEIIGVGIRPLTLGVRLATNISCGHVVLLMFSFFSFNVMSYLVISISILLYGLYFIEFLVCVIQAYVFWSLLYVYLIEIEI